LTLSVAEAYNLSSGKLYPAVYLGACGQKGNGQPVIVWGPGDPDVFAACPARLCTDFQAISLSLPG